MATANINSVYPPIVESSLPAFPVDNESLFVTFTLPLVVNFDNVKNIAVRIVQQSNNKSVLNSNTYYDGIMYFCPLPELETLALCMSGHSAHKKHGRSHDAYYSSLLHISFL